MANGRAFGVVLGVGALAGLGYLLFSARRASAASLGSPREREFIPQGDSAPAIKVPASVEAWMPFVEKLAPKFNIPPNFVRAWLTVESGGNPCSIGSPWENIAGQGPAESGPFQLMYPHDIKQAETTVAEMRANCATPMPSFPGLSRSSPAPEKARARAIAEAQGRPLTEEERTRHTLAGLTYIAKTMKLVDATGVGWSPSDPGYWGLVKAHHGAWSWPAAGVQLAKQGLGRMPKDWDDLVQGIRSTPHASAHDVAIENATKTMKMAFPKAA